MSKQFAATAVMMLVEEVKVGLDDRLTKYFPAAPRWIFLDQYLLDDRPHDLRCGLPVPEPGKPLDPVEDPTVGEDALVGDEPLDLVAREDHAAMVFVTAGTRGNELIRLCASSDIGAR